MIPIIGVVAISVSYFVIGHLVGHRIGYRKGRRDESAARTKKFSTRSKLGEALLKFYGGRGP